MRMSEKCRNNNNSDNPLTFRRTNRGKKKRWCLGRNILPISIVKPAYRLSKIQLLLLCSNVLRIATITCIINSTTIK